MSRIILTGDKELQRLLESLPTKVANKLARTALRKAGKMVLESARAKVPEDSGALKKGLKVKALKRSRNRMGVVVEHPDRLTLAKLQPTAEKAREVYSGSGYYPAAVEYGAPHAPAQPHLRPALEDKKSEVIAEFRTELKAAVEAEKAK